ncbi:MAG: DNA-binding response regulator [Nitriliruptor sp.]|nr:MAG: DNA-binding response regulator [Nitriliruptor sp.]
MVLDDEPDIEVVAEAGDGRDAVERAREHVPDVVVLDVRMPTVSGIDAARLIRGDQPGTRILMLTISDEEDDLFEAVKAGANGYLLKEISIDEIADAVRSIHAGQSLITPSMASKLLTEFAELVRKEEPVPQDVPAPRLTPREMEVLQELAKGLSNRDIAQSLSIAENTVKNHVRNILEKLHLHSRMQAVLYAVRQNLLDIE